jgi:hypothetical protein
MNKIKDYKSKIDNMLQMCKNPWIPPPLFSMVEEEEEIEKVNEEINPETIDITIGKLTYSNLNSYIELDFPYANDKKLERRINKPSGTSDFKWSDKIKFEKNEFKYLHRKAITLNIVEKTG